MIALLRVWNNGAKVRIILLIHHWVLLARGKSSAEGAIGLVEDGYENEERHSKNFYINDSFIHGLVGIVVMGDEKQC